MEEQISRSACRKKKGNIFLVGAIMGAFIGAVGMRDYEACFKDILEVSTIDVNGDSRKDVLLEHFIGNPSIYIQQEGGNYVSLDRYIQTRQDSLKTEIGVYRDSIEARIGEGSNE